MKYGQPELWLKLSSTNSSYDTRKNFKRHKFNSRPFIVQQWMSNQYKKFVILWILRWSDYLYNLFMISYFSLLNEDILEKNMLFREEHSILTSSGKLTSSFPSFEFLQLLKCQHCSFSLKNSWERIFFLFFSVFLYQRFKIKVWSFMNCWALLRPCLQVFRINEEVHKALKAQLRLDSFPK